MIHTDGRPTICTRGALPEELSARVENLARDLAAVYNVSLEEARRRILGSARLPNLDDLAETLVSEHPELD